MSSRAKILIGVSGGIAAFKSAALVSQLAQNQFDVTVAMTEAATRFVGSQTFAALSGNPVVMGLFDSNFPLGAHIELARQADYFCIAPATANFIGKIAHGICDDLLTTLFLCFEGEVAIAPAMNCEMWNKASVQRNLEQVRSDGVQIIEPGEGWLSCRERGVGRMAEADEIFQFLNSRIGTENSGDDA